MGGTFTHRFGVTANDTPDDLSDLFANGEIGDWWRFDSENTTVNEADLISTATGIVNGRLMTQTTDGLKPTLSSANGDEFAHFTTCVMSHSLGVTVDQPGTIIICVGDSDTGTHVIITGGSSTLRWQISNDPSDNIIMYAGASKDTTVNANFGTKVFTGEYNGVSSVFRQNGTQVASGTPGTQSTNKITIGAAYDNTFFGTINIYSVLFINRILTSDERDRAERLFGSHAALAW